MKNSLLSIVIILAILIAGVFALSNFYKQKLDNDPPDETLSDLEEYIASKSDLIVLHEPEPLSSVSSPLSIKGQARGTWYFEGDFPIVLLDGNGAVITQWFASAVLDPNDPSSTWMTEDFVPFEAELIFTTPATSEGTLVLHKDNPSGLPEHNDELRIPLSFLQSELPQRNIELYYYNASEDMDGDGNIMCSNAGLVQVRRTIPVTQTPIQDTIRLLLLGQITAQEQAMGITTEYPLFGFELEGASLADKVLTLSFKDPNNASSGGSCRSGILWLQIQETAMQFSEVEEVRFQPEELFQP